MHIRIEAVIQTNDLDEGDVGYIVDRFLESRFDALDDLVVYQIYVE